MLIVTCKLNLQAHVINSYCLGLRAIALKRNIREVVVICITAVCELRQCISNSGFCPGGKHLVYLSFVIIWKYLTRSLSLLSDAVHVVAA